jgi:hypothetical protein
MVAHTPDELPDAIQDSPETRMIVAHYEQLVKAVVRR